MAISYQLTTRLEITADDSKKMKSVSIFLVILFFVAVTFLMICLAIGVISYAIG
jgi:hypothetical protein